MLTLPLVSLKPLLKRKVASKLVHSAVPLTFNKKEREERGKPKSLVNENFVTIQVIPPKLALYLWKERILYQSVDRRF